MQERDDKQVNRRPRQSMPGNPPARHVDSSPLPPEFGGPEGPEPTRYGDWERGGRCSDF